MLEKGIKKTLESKVTEENTAKAMGSGELMVYATPAMIALMEETAYKSVATELDEGCGSVGTRMDVKHIAASPVGMPITCKSELVEVDGRRLVFHVEAFDENGLIGEGTHERFIVVNEKFQNKTDSKLD
ncbi:MAG: thioesterase family protein [Butyribacter sp.]|nr:thioesterase family protein [bacterium]MDY3853467.1 thioesterase family protein [Butyribacter sp.]